MKNKKSKNREHYCEPQFNHCFHCWHPSIGIIHMYIPQGKALEQCCQCNTTRLVSIYHHREPWKLPKFPKFTY